LLPLCHRPEPLSTVMGKPDNSAAHHIQRRSRRNAMRNRLPLLFIVLMLIFGMAAWAQNNSTQTSSAAGGGQQTLKGCIVQVAQDYYLVPLTGGQKVHLTGADVSQHTNHEVSVHGTQQSASSTASTGTVGANAGSTANAPEFAVAQVDMIAESCPASTKQHTPGSSQPPQ
jgi:hypothetical protein